MGLRVNSNIASLNAQRSLSTTTERLQANYRRLSTGLRISTASDDAAGLAISERFLVESFSALALPPLSPPSRPRATAAGFFSGSAGFFLAGLSAGSPVIDCKIWNAVTFTSVDGFFFFMPPAYMTA